MHHVPYIHGSAGEYVSRVPRPAVDPPPDMSEQVLYISYIGSMHACVPCIHRTTEGDDGAHQPEV